ncbi:DMT family transporter [bacterium]|nr:DMT family transporter [bacterium]
MIRIGATAGIVAISFSAIFVQLAGLSPLTTAVFRGVYSIPLLAVIYLITRSGDARPLKARLVAGVAGLALAIDLTMWHISIDMIGAGVSTVLANTQVLWVALIGWLVYRERPSRTALVVIPVVLIGVAMISGLGRTDAYGDDPVAGALLGLGAGVMYAIFVLLLRESNRGHLAPAAGPLLDATIGMTLASIVIGLFDPDFSWAWEWPGHGWMIVFAIVSQVLGWMLISTALPRLPALDTSILLLLQPSGALVWAGLILSEQPSAMQWAGVAIVLAGVVIAGTRGSVARERALTPAEEATPRSS